uniref:Uncharacterized protein n=1 Tax=Plectus sambesii TaxID=2011161 RepID=A0A914XAY3_9BILA
MTGRHAYPSEHLFILCCGWLVLGSSCRHLIVASVDIMNAAGRPLMSVARPICGGPPVDDSSEGRGWSLMVPAFGCRANLSDKWRQGARRDT